MINRVVLAGRLTKDPEVKKTDAGISILNFTLAIDRQYLRNNSAQNADFVPCLVWRHGADFLGTYAKKGQMVGVDGVIQTRSYTRNDGSKAYVTEVLAENVSILEKKQTSDGQMSDQYTPDLQINPDDLPY